MNKNQIFNKKSETNAHGSLRTAKWAKGAVAVVGLASAGILATAGSNVSADEVTGTTAPSTEVVAQPAVATPVVESAPVAETVQPVASAPVAEVAAAPVEAPAVAETVQPVAAEAPVETMTNSAVDVVTTTNGNTTTVDTTERQAAVADAKKVGVDVETNEKVVNLGTASTVAEETELQNQAKASIDKETAAVEAKTKEALESRAEAEANSTKDGYASEVIVQTLIFKDEPNVDSVEVEGQYKNIASNAKAINRPEIPDLWTYSSYEYLERNPESISERLEERGEIAGGYGGYSEKSYWIIAEKGKPVTVTYKGLDNSYYGNTKIGSVIYKYTALQTEDDNPYIVMQIMKDPTLGIKYGSMSGVDLTKYLQEKGQDKGDLFDDSKKWYKDMNLEITYFDESGNKINLQEGTAYLGAGSRNLSFGSAEYVKANGKSSFIPINGSSVTMNDDGKAYALEQDKEVDGVAWDEAGSPTAWYGAAILETVSDENGTISLDFGSTKASPQEWFRVSSELFANGVIVNPSATVNTYTYNTVGSVTTIHVTEDGTVLIPKETKVDNSETGTSYDVSAHDNKIVTGDGKTYTFVSVTPNAKGSVELGTIDVVFTYKEVKGNVVVDYQNKSGETLSPRVVDTPSSSTGTSYDTTDNKPVKIVTEDGKTWKIDTAATKGSESGEVVEGTTQVVYIYDEVTGDVTVHYTDEEGNVIKDPVKDTNDASTGTDYDTTDNKPNKVVTKDGKTYTIIPDKTKGNEQGKVTEGDTKVTYVYKEVFGNVTVHYTDKDGNVIKDPVKDTDDSSTGVPYDTTDHKPTVIKDGIKQYNLVPDLTKGNETGKVTEGNTDVTYVYKRVGDVTTVSVTTDGEVLIPKVLKIDDQEVGTGYDVSAHENKIVTEDGRTFKFVQVTNNAKGNIKDGVIDVVFTYEEVFGDVTVHYTDKDGNVIKNPVTDTPLTSTGKNYSTVDNKPTIIEHDGDKYIIIPNLTKGEEEGKVKEGNTTVTYVYNKLEAIKGVTNDKGDNVDNGVLNIGDKGSYSLTGASVLASIFQDGKGQYAFEDDLDEKHDKLLSSELILVKDITLEDGTVIKSGADLLKYAQESYDGNVYKVSLNSDFLKSIADDQELQVQAILNFERIAAGEVTNTFQNIINGEVVGSNTVKTTTPEPTKPSEPGQPTAKVVENVPVAQASVATLPSTGEEGSALLSVLGVMSIVSVAFVARKKKQA
uniref:MucBP domain-containing protein n=1 Tax=Streptococcus pluranimalium TaxID=82348 RepID=UPI003F69171D